MHTFIGIFFVVAVIVILLCLDALIEEYESDDIKVNSFLQRLAQEKPDMKLSLMFKGEYNPEDEPRSILDYIPVISFHLLIAIPGPIYHYTFLIEKKMYVVRLNETAHDEKGMPQKQLEMTLSEVMAKRNGYSMLKEWNKK